MIAAFENAGKREKPTSFVLRAKPGARIFLGGGEIEELQEGEEVVVTGLHNKDGIFDVLVPGKEIIGSMDVDRATVLIKLSAEQVTSCTDALFVAQDFLSRVDEPIAPELWGNVSSTVMNRIGEITGLQTGEALEGGGNFFSNLEQANSVARWFDLPTEDGYIRMTLDDVDNLESNISQLRDSLLKGIEGKDGDVYITPDGKIQE